MAIGYKEFEAQARAMRDQLVAAATAEADKWLDMTLAMMRRLPGEQAEMQAPAGQRQSLAPAIPIQEYRQSDKKTLTSVTRAALASIGDREFDSVELRRMIEPQWKPMDDPTQRANLANLLRRMVERDELELVEQGTGARPSRFRRKAVKATEMADTEHG